MNLFWNDTFYIFICFRKTWTFFNLVQIWKEEHFSDKGKKKLNTNNIWSYEQNLKTETFCEIMNNFWNFEQYVKFPNIKKEKVTWHAERLRRLGGQAARRFTVDMSRVYTRLWVFSLGVGVIGNFPWSISHYLQTYQRSFYSRSIGSTGRPQSSSWSKHHKGTCRYRLQGYRKWDW